MDMFQDWTDIDSGLAATALYAIHEDIQSTKKFLKEGREEENPLLGIDPSDRDLRVAQALASALAVGAAGLMKGKNRKIFLGALAGLEHQVAKDNKDPGTGSIWSDSSSRAKGVGMAIAGAIIGAALDEIDPDLSIQVFGDSEEVGVGVTKKF